MKSIVRALLTYGTYPGVVIGGLLVTKLLYDAGVEPGLAVAGSSLAFGILIFGLQFVHPHTDEWRIDCTNLKLDITHALVSMGGTTALIKAAMFGVLFEVSNRLSIWYGSDIWPSHWPIATQLALALCAGEFGAYWIHRISHEHGFMWRIHLLHHSPEALNLLSSGRNHPISVFASYATQMTTLILLGANAEVLALQSVFSGVHGLVQHANIKMETGWLDYLFSTPRLHRWHHSRSIAESDHNYGSNVIIWDIIFGSFFCPTKREPSNDLGLPHGTQWTNSFWAHMKSPFVWGKIKPAGHGVLADRPSKQELYNTAGVPR